MPSIRSRARAIGLALGTLLVGVLMLYLLEDARDSGLDALERSLTAEVSATARSQDQRVSGSLESAGSVVGQGWELTPGSQADEAMLRELLEIVPDIRTGFFLTDASLRITQGVNLEDPSIIGTTYDWEGVEQLASSPRFLGGVGGYLPVGEGVTVETPVLPTVVPITRGGELRGMFVFEGEITSDSTLNEEIKSLGRGETGRYLFYDSNGTVIAASDPALLGDTVPDERFLGAPLGLSDFGGHVVVIEEVPSAGWRIAFQQERDEFEAGLVGPLQSVGRITVLAFTVLAAVVFVALNRRLRVAREEQARLRRLQESQEEFISIVSHELRTPVAGVLGFLQTCLDHWDTMSDDARHDAVVRSASNARRLQSLTRDVLDVEAAESGRMSYSMDGADLSDEVAVAVDAARDLYPDHRFDLKVPAGAVTISADVDRIQQVLTNLLDNAARLSPTTEPIEVAVEVLDGSARVSVVDRGPGLAPGGASRVFEKFSRGPVGSVAGTGLGLYISRQIVEAHGGTIDVVSEAGAGATFVITLPLAAQDAAVSETAPADPAGR